MRTKFALIGGIGCGLLLFGSLALAGTDDEELKKLQAEVQLATARAQLAKLTYGEPSNGKSGNVGEPGNLSTIALQRSLALSAATARDLGAAVVAASKTSVQCAEKSLLVTDDAAATTRLMTAITLDEKLSVLQRKVIDLEDRMSKPQEAALEVRSLALDAQVLQGAANSIVGIWKLFQADYTVGAFAQTNNQDWVLANFLIGTDCGACAYSSRFPSTKEAVDLSNTVSGIVQSAETVKRKAEKFANSKDEREKQLLAEATELVKAVTAVQAALLDGGSTGVAPVATLAPYLRAKTESSCIVRIIDTAPGGMVLTKETIFGKGGKAYLHSTTQLAAIVTDINGVPRRMVCRQRDLAVNVRLKDLTRKDAPPEVPAWKKGASRDSTDCLN